MLTGGTERQSFLVMTGSESILEDPKSTRSDIYSWFIRHVPGPVVGDSELSVGFDLRLFL
jgi:hypothetical protein